MARVEPAQWTYNAAMLQRGAWRVTMCYARQGEWRIEVWALKQKMGHYSDVVEAEAWRIFFEQVRKVVRK